MLILTSKNANNQDFLIKVDTLSTHLKRERAETTQGLLDFMHDKSWQTEQQPTAIETIATVKGFNVKGFHGTSGKKSIAEEQQFSPKYLGAATGAGSAKEAFFFAKSPGTAAEYAVLDIGEPAFGDWFWQPSNANDVIEHMRNLMFGVNVSGNQIHPDVKDMPKELWDDYGHAIQKFLKAETPEERRQIYADFRNPEKNSDAYQAVHEAVYENARKEAEEAVWDDVQYQPKADINNQIRELHTKNLKIWQENKELAEQWMAESFAEFPSGTLKERERLEKLLNKHPDNHILQELFQNAVKIEELKGKEDRLETQGEKKEWGELTPQEQHAFISEHQDEINHVQDDIVSQNQSLRIFSDVDAEKLPLDRFEWKYGFDPSGFSIDEYYLSMQNPLVKEYEDYRDEKFISVIQKAKQGGHDSVIFRNVRDGGGLDDIYAVFTPNQIKSAAPVTYDAGGHPIPLEKRFDISTPNLNY